MSIQKLLIANRGEIAVRVIRSARALGIQTVAVHSDADTDAPHVRLADEAVLIGPAPVGESYLRAEKLIAACQATGADAVHPGYGFLSENADFARACDDAGITFVGPTAEAIDLMGDKARAKVRMIDAGVPCVPGYQGDDQSDENLLAEATRVGFPLMVKAAAGGGGRGMRLVNEGEDVARAINTARSEAKNAFGDDRLILEKAIVEPRHVEIQVFADTHGNVVHLGERDCSVQRRHQKVIEEAPSPAVTPEIRAAMGGAATQAAKAIDYRGAGTVEFLLDRDGNFYFLEMNTRLQVEHPVTEEITGTDLVEWQLRVAEGDELPLTQDQISINGHAIEVRLYAEAPAKDFLPQTGTAHVWQTPESAGLRVDSGLAEGQEVSPFYDPMVAKIIAHGANREDARRRMIDALRRTSLIGIENNRRFLIDALAHDAFAAGDATTAFIGDYFPQEKLQQAEPSLRDQAAAAVLVFDQGRTDAPVAFQGWRSSGQPARNPVHMSLNGEQVEASVVWNGGDEYQVLIGDDTITLDAVTVSGDRMSWRQDGREARARHVTVADKTWLQTDTADLEIIETTYIDRAAAAAEGSGMVQAPMNGRVLKVNVEAGAKVATGDVLLVLEAMKMEHEIQADADGTVVAVNAAEGDQVAPGSVLIEIETDEKDG